MMLSPEVYFLFHLGNYLSLERTVHIANRGNKINNKLGNAMEHRDKKNS